MRSLQDLEEAVKEVKEMSFVLADMVHAQGVFLGDVHTAFGELGDVGRPAMLVISPALKEMAERFKESTARMKRGQP